MTRFVLSHTLDSALRILPELIIGNIVTAFTQCFVYNKRKRNNNRETLTMLIGILPHLKLATERKTL